MQTAAGKASAAEWHETHAVRAAWRAALGEELSATLPCHEHLRSSGHEAPASCSSHAHEKGTIGTDSSDLANAAKAVLGGVAGYR